jgi:hypothetical protein
MEPRKLQSSVLKKKIQSESKPCYGDQRCDVGKQSSVPCVYRGRTRVNLDGLSDQIRAARMKNQAGRLPALLPAIADGQDCNGERRADCLIERIRMGQERLKTARCLRDLPVPLVCNTIPPPPLAYCPVVRNEPGTICIGALSTANRSSCLDVASENRHFLATSPVTPNWSRKTCARFYPYMEARRT